MEENKNTPEEVIQSVEQTPTEVTSAVEETVVEETPVTIETENEEAAPVADRRCRSAERARRHR